MEIVGINKISDFFFEITPGNTRSMLNMSFDGMKAVDATSAGFRAAPEVSQTGLNLSKVKCTPAVVATSWGDFLIFDKVLNFPRADPGILFWFPDPFLFFGVLRID